MNLNYNEKNSLLMEGKDVPVISVAEMREADRRTIEGGVPSKELMRRAAQGVYDANERGWEGKRTLIICGSGNNGGDGYALAAIMKDQGLEPEILMVSDKFSEDGEYYHDICVEKGVTVFEKECLTESAANQIDWESYDIFVDCMFGTGFAGVPREPAADVIRHINREREKRVVFVISVDINSGMNGDTGEAELAVVSDLTVSIGFYKHGFFKGRAPELIGRLTNADIGIRLD